MSPTLPRAWGRAAARAGVDRCVGLVGQDGLLSSYPLPHQSSRTTYGPQGHVWQMDHFHLLPSKEHLVPQPLAKSLSLRAQLGRASPSLHPLWAAVGVLRGHPPALSSPPHLTDGSCQLSATIPCDKGRPFSASATASRNFCSYPKKGSIIKSLCQTLAPQPHSHVPLPQPWCPSGPRTGIQDTTRPRDPQTKGGRENSHHCPPILAPGGTLHAPPPSSGPSLGPWSLC